MCFCRARFLLWAVIATLGAMSLLSACGAKGDLYLPKPESERQQAR